MGARFVRHDDAVMLEFRVGCVYVCLFSCVLVSRVRTVDVATDVLGSCVLVSRVRDADVATDVLGSYVHSRSLLKKKVERCKGSVELSDFTSKASQQD